MNKLMLNNNKNIFSNELLHHLVLLTSYVLWNFNTLNRINTFSLCEMMANNCKMINGWKHLNGTYSNEPVLMKCRSNFTLIKQTLLTKMNHQLTILWLNQWPKLTKHILITTQALINQILQTTLMFCYSLEK